MVNFSETDMAGIVHFSNFFKYMEETEHAFLLSLDYSVYDNQEDGTVISWPRLNVECEYFQPLYFEDQFEIELKVQKRTNKTLTYEFTFEKNDAGETKKIATGKATVVCALIDKNTHQMKSIEIPEKFNEIQVEKE